MDNKLELIEWIINEASDDQLDGLYEIVKNQDYNYGVEKLIDDEDEYQEYINGFKGDNE